MLGCVGVQQCGSWGARVQCSAPHTRVPHPAPHIFSLHSDPALSRSACTRFSETFPRFSDAASLNRAGAGCSFEGTRTLHHEPAPLLPESAITRTRTRNCYLRECDVLLPTMEPASGPAIPQTTAIPSRDADRIAPTLAGCGMLWPHALLTRGALGDHAVACGLIARRAGLAEHVWVGGVIREAVGPEGHVVPQPLGVVVVALTWSFTTRAVW